MSKSWSGGKGDTSRVTDWDKYRENYDRIFQKKPDEVKPHQVSTDDAPAKQHAYWCNGHPCECHLKED